MPHAAARVGLMHIGVFILLLLSGERNFGVRLNKPYSVRVPMDIPVFTGTHADLLIVVRGLLLPGPGCVGMTSSWQSLEAAGSPWPSLCLPTQVFHKIITSGHQRLQPLFDCLLTIVVNGRGPGACLPCVHHQVAPGHRVTCHLLSGSNPPGPTEIDGQLPMY